MKRTLALPMRIIYHTFVVVLAWRSASCATSVMKDIIYTVSMMRYRPDTHTDLCTECPHDLANAV